MYINRGNKVCEMCGAEYVPNNRQYKKQRYCSKKCKNKRQWEKKVESGVACDAFSLAMDLEIEKRFSSKTIH